MNGDEIVVLAERVKRRPLGLAFWRRLGVGLALALAVPVFGGGAGEAGLPSAAVVERPENFGQMIKGVVEPQWFDGGRRFWYRNDLGGGAREFVLVDAESGVRGPAFDHDRLAAALSLATGDSCRPTHLPFERIEYVDGVKAVWFRVGEVAWRCGLEAYDCVRTEVPAGAGAGADAGAGRGNGRGRRRRSGDEAGATPVPSPDGRWLAVVKESNLFLKAAGDGGEEVPLTDDGRDKLAYGLSSWSPDSRHLVAWRVAEVERQQVHLLESSPKDGGRARLASRGYVLPGDPFPVYHPVLIEVSGRRSIPLAVDGWEHEWQRPRLRWNLAGDRFAYEQVDRGHQRYRVVEVEVATGEVRQLIDERAETFIWSAHTEEVGLSRLTWLKATDEAIHVSERDGWRHLYLLAAGAAGGLRPITSGDFVVRGIDWIDEGGRQIWFSAGGRVAGQDPYFRHHYRVNFDGTGLVALTEGNGDHRVQYSPDRRYLVDTYSRVDEPPVHELRRTQDGSLVCVLEAADISGLRAAGWSAPEVFSAKGRDGVTDIWGIIIRPADFDPSKKYPVVEDIYAGPHGAFVPKVFEPGRRHDGLTGRGFIVVQIDGMGTAHRSKAFHDVCWRNLKDGGFPDRILWMKAAAARYPEMDLTRVGIFGTSAGGQSAAGALLFHPEFYRAGVANCGCHDNRLDKASWNEQWMGYPVGPQYAESSNIEQAHRLRGRLFLIVGELDDNVPPESTLRLADALIRAGKDFDLLVVPGGGHGAGGAYGQRRMEDFFVRHLLGVDPPDRNGNGEASR